MPLTSGSSSTTRTLPTCRLGIDAGRTDSADPIFVVTTVSSSPTTATTGLTT